MIKWNVHAINKECLKHLKRRFHNFTSATFSSNMFSSLGSCSWNKTTTDMFYPECSASGLLTRLKGRRLFPDWAEWILQFLQKDCSSPARVVLWWFSWFSAVYLHLLVIVWRASPAGGRASSSASQMWWINQDRTHKHTDTRTQTAAVKLSASE